MFHIYREGHIFQRFNYLLSIPLDIVFPRQKLDPFLADYD